MNKISLPYIGSYIRKKRIDAGLSTQSFSEELNVSAGFINNLENGKTDAFKLELLIEILSVLNVDSLPLGKSKQLKIIDATPTSHDFEMKFCKKDNLFDPEIEKLLNYFMDIFEDLLLENSTDRELAKFFILKLIKEISFLKNIKKVNFKNPPPLI